MELLQLKYFFESAKSESFARTAEKYMVPSASVSASVKRLEKELGCELFHRASNRIFLNDNGRSLQASLAIAFGEIDQAVDKLTSITTDHRAIKLLVRGMRDVITDYIIEYKARHPHIAFNTVFNFEDMNFDNYDIIVDEKADRYPQYEKFDLYTTKIQLRASSSNPLCGKSLVLKQLSDQPFISIGENNGMHEIFVSACKKAGFTPNIIIQCNDLLCNRKFVEAGVGIGLGRAYPWGEPLKGVEVLNITDFQEMQTICCYYKEQSAYGNVEHFLNFMKTKVN